MPEMIEVYYEGWGERWLWGRLISSTANRAAVDCL